MMIKNIPLPDYLPQECFIVCDWLPYLFFTQLTLFWNISCVPDYHTVFAFYLGKSITCSSWGCFYLHIIYYCGIDMTVISLMKTTVNSSVHSSTTSTPSRLIVYLLQTATKQKKTGHSSDLKTFFLPSCMLLG